MTAQIGLVSGLRESIISLLRLAVLAGLREPDSRNAAPLVELFNCLIAIPQNENLVCISAWALKPSYVDVATTVL